MGEKLYPANKARDISSNSVKEQSEALSWEYINDLIKFQCHHGRLYAEVYGTKSLSKGVIDKVRISCQYSL